MSVKTSALKRSYVSLLACLMLSFSGIVQAGFLGSSTVSIAGRTPSNEEVHSVLIDAKNQAVISYLEQFREDALVLYDECQKSDEKIASFIADFKQFPDSGFDKKTKQYLVKISAQIHNSRLERWLTSCQPADMRYHRVALVMVARQKTGDSKDRDYTALDARLDEAMARVFQRKRFEVNATSGMESLSNGVFKKRRLIEQYANSGQVNWDSALWAADVSWADLLVVGFIDAGIPQKSQINTLLELVVSGNAYAIDVANNTLVASTKNFSSSIQGVDEEALITAATDRVTQVISTQIIDQLFASGL